MADRTWVPDDVPLDKPSPARMWDYYLGGYHNFAVDRAAAEAALAVLPDLRLVTQANRAFLRRAVKFLVGAGIDQFLDLGSGIPTVGNVHEVAQQLNPNVRVVYVDSDLVAVRHSQTILQGNPNVVAIRADVRHLDQILDHPQVRRLLDFDRPIGVLLLALLHFVVDDEAAYNLVRQVRDAMAPGSYLAISHAALESAPAEVHAKMENVYARSTSTIKSRSRAQVAHFFDGLELVEPGLVYTPLWRPEGPEDIFLDQPARSTSFCAVGRKPA